MYPSVYGLQIDERTGCAHYNSALDIVAIKFKCCDCYYCCYLCHLEMADHPARRWEYGDLCKKAILCGYCGIEMTIYEYISSENQCPNCQSPFNPGCRSHWHLYFEDACCAIQE